MLGLPATSDGWSDPQMLPRPICGRVMRTRMRIRMRVRIRMRIRMMRMGMRISKGQGTG
jgi:hypothetical protein